MKFNYFLSLVPEWEIVQKHSKRSNILCGVEVNNLFGFAYWEVKKIIPDLLQENKYDEAFHLIVKNVKFTKVKKENNFKKLKFLFWIFDQYEMIGKLEKERLRTRIDQKLINAGIKRMEVLGDFPLIDSIAKDYNYTHEQAKMLPYETIFEIQLKSKIENDIKVKMEELNKK